MRTTLFAVVALAALTTSSRSNAQQNDLSGFAGPVAVFTFGVPGALTLSAAGLDVVLATQLAGGTRAPSRGLAITAIALSAVSAAWNTAGLALSRSDTPAGWVAGFASGLAVNLAELVFSVITLVVPQTVPAVVVAPMAVPSGAGAALAFRW
jgi:hypothetical protein